VWNGCWNEPWSGCLHTGCGGGRVPANAFRPGYTPRSTTMTWLAEPGGDPSANWPGGKASLPPAPAQKASTPASGQLLPWGAVLKAVAPPLDDRHHQSPSKRWVYRQ